MTENISPHVCTSVELGIGMIAGFGIALVYVPEPNPNRNLTREDLLEMISAADLGQDPFVARPARPDQTYVPGRVGEWNVEWRYEPGSATSSTGTGLVWVDETNVWGEETTEALERWIRGSWDASSRWGE